MGRKILIGILSLLAILFAALLLMDVAWSLERGDPAITERDTTYWCIPDPISFTLILVKGEVSLKATVSAAVFATKTANLPFVKLSL